MTEVRGGIQKVESRPDFPALERDLLATWDRDGIVEKYLHRNDASEERYSFLDGPITANNPMGVHHAWGRTYKDLFQRYQTMLGKRQRYQNGFDCQGLWVEVEVEKELGFKSKRDIESFGIAEFVERCKQRVLKSAARITSQSVRLGYWMAWGDSYLTMSDENNYTIWHFLKSVNDRGWLYKGHDVMPWCPRCGTGISEHEIVTEGYQERTHLAVFVAFPLRDEPDANLLVWTTTPWTLTANIAAAVHPELTYVQAKQNGKSFYVAKEAMRTALRGDSTAIRELRGRDLIGREYQGPFDELSAQAGVSHRVIGWDEVDAAEGTGIVHIAPGAGKEDFALSKLNELAVIAPIDEFGVYGDGFGSLTGQYVHEVAVPIAEDLDAKGLLYRAEHHRHRYPVCWRCDTDLVFRLVDEWFIAMDDLRQPMMDATRQTTWYPGFGLDRELDWLRHMDDWMISKKRYWGLALPIYECPTCGNVDVIGSETELQERAVSGWEAFAGHSPHRPWVDEVKIACSQCGQTVTRINDVGNPWLDAGIVPFSTLNYRHDPQYWEEWFPADMISESFPGQFRNWFYSMIAQSAALVNRPAFQNVFAYALMRDEKGEEMHKSKGNAIWFDEAADEIGVDVMRWLFSRANPDANLNFGHPITDEVRRRFILPLWNSYAFFATYASIDHFDPTLTENHVALAARPVLDRWIISQLHRLITSVRAALDDYAPDRASLAIERFTIDELSNWYIRRNRRRFWKSENDADKAAAYQTLHECLTTLSRLVAPFIPFLAESIYQNLQRSVDSGAAESVHLTDYPVSDPEQIDTSLSRDMDIVLEVVGAGHAARQEAQIKVRQPLAELQVYSPDPGLIDSVLRLRALVEDELNVKAIAPLDDPGLFVSYSIRPNLRRLGPRLGKQLSAVREALSELDPAKIAESVASGLSIDVSTANGPVTLEPDDLLVDAVKLPGFAAAQGPRTTVVLDTSLTPDLIQEGWARDFVRGVQDARKRAGYRIEDYIVIDFIADPGVVRAVDAHRTYVMGETLASRLIAESSPGASDAVEPEVVAGPGGLILHDGWYADQISVGTHSVRITLSPSPSETC
ncbi:MAG: isoleucine--tRNA ligase [Chloroflexota bacterium]|nr:isoleucine--tRNA ligase [Chloroflexota bacterium]